MLHPPARPHIQFGAFEIDPVARELRKHGIRIRLQDQPFQVLLALVERPGELVAREELRQRLWPSDTFVDFDQSLNRAINKVREALGDLSGTPRFIETLPKRGYRFIAPVQGAEAPMEGRLPVERPKRAMRRTLIAAAGLAALVLIGGLASWIFIAPTPPVVRLRQITTDSEPKSWPVVSDGSHVYYLSATGVFESSLMRVPVSGGLSTRLPIGLPGTRTFLQDLSPDGQELLMTADDFRTGLPLRSSGPSPVWIMRVSDGSTRRVGMSAYRARYSPDGRRLAWTTEDRLFVGAADGSNAREIASVSEWNLDVMSWHSDDEIILRCSDKKRPASYAWQIAPNGSGFRRTVPEWSRTHDLAVSSRGSFRLLLSEGALWALPLSRWPVPPSRGAPSQITFGNPELLVPSRTRDGRLFTVGVVRLGELQRFDPITRAWQRHLDGISADCAEYSRDGRWVAYVRYPERSLWRCRADGTQCLQLAERRFGAHLPHWSPDGTAIAFNARAPGESWRIWLVNADGSNLRLAAPRHAGGQVDPVWTGSGKKVVFASSCLETEEPCYLQILDIESGQVTRMPGTDGFWSVKASPDGSRLLALASGRELLGSISILDPNTGEWRRASEDYAMYPTWASDNRSIVYASREGIRRFRLDTWKAETIVGIDRLAEIYGNLGWPWVGQDPAGAPLILRNRDITQVYEIEFTAK